MGGWSPSLERAQLGLLAALAATIPLSIFAAEALLALGVVVLAARLLARRARLAGTPLDTPLLAFAVWTLLSASFAQDPVRAHEAAKKLVLFALFYLAVEVLSREEDGDRVLGAVLAGGLALSALMILQRHALGYDHINRRPPGFLGHYMSASGVVMVVLLLAAARIGLSPRVLPRLRDLAAPGLVLVAVATVAAAAAAGHAVPATRAFVLAAVVLGAALALSRGRATEAAVRSLPWVVLPVSAWALVVSQTRSAWVGALVGLGVLAVLRAPRLLWLLAAGAVAVLVIRPAALNPRLTISDESSRDRYYMWQAGVDMVLDRPVFGQGPGMILGSYPRYRWPEATNPQQPHLHNNLLQVAAERGIPGLALFLWWFAAVLVCAVREAPRDATRGTAWPAAAALAGLAAVFAAGLFEYNLGDSEVLMLVLLLAAVPFARARRRAAGP